MKALCVHTVPMAEDDFGYRWPEMDDSAPIKVVGWCNVIEIQIEGDPRLFLFNDRALP